MSKSLDVYDVFAALVNGGYILRVENSVFGPTKYFVNMPGGRSPDSKLGHITEGIAFKLWNKGFLYAPSQPRREKSGLVLTAFYLHKPVRSLSDHEDPADET